MPPRWIADSSVWIDLENGGILDAAFALMVTWSVPDLLLVELQRPPTAEDLKRRGVDVIGLTPIQVAELAATTARDPRISVVDVAAFVLARDSGGMLLTGDARLRALTEGQAVEVHGVLWLLDHLIKKLLITPTEAAEALDRMMAAGARLPRTEVESRLTLWRA